MRAPSSIRSFALLLSLLGACDCGSSPSKLDCVGSSCSCPAGDTCHFGASACGVDGGSCTLECLDQNTCSGTCGDSCSVSCANGSTCSPTVGASGSVTCATGATCHVTCLGSCSVSCSGATCDLTCGANGSPVSLGAGGQCP